MDTQMSTPQESQRAEESAVRALYFEMLDGWNTRDGDAFAAAFDEDGETIGFDGSLMAGRAEIAATLRHIFADHPTPPYLAKVKSVRLLTSEVAILRAAVGMVPPGKTDVEPGLNAIQSIVATKRDDRWRIAHLQNTPAQFHGRPEMVREMTEELRELL